MDEARGRRWGGEGGGVSSGWSGGEVLWGGQVRKRPLALPLNTGYQVTSTHHTTRKGLAKQPGHPLGGMGKSMTTYTPHTPPLLSRRGQGQGRVERRVGTASHTPQLTGIGGEGREGSVTCAREMRQRGIRRGG